MARYIDADNMKSIKNIQSANFNSIESIREWIDSQPTADVRKNVKVQKVLAGGILDGTTHWYECSCCHGAVDILDAYCKHCGALLELENDL